MNKLLHIPSSLSRPSLGNALFYSYGEPPMSTKHFFERFTNESAMTLALDFI